MVRPCRMRRVPQRLLPQRLLPQRWLSLAVAMLAPHSGGRVQAADCPPGKCSEDLTCVWDCQCRRCKAGRFCAGNDAFCADKERFCTAGTFANAMGSTSCTACATGTFSVLGATQCAATGNFNPATLAMANRPARDSDQGWKQRTCHDATLTWSFEVGQAASSCSASQPRTCPESLQRATDLIYAQCGGTKDLSEVGRRGHL
jgi:hypothetical protein|eukprot:COSAG01_NODE_12603_length_1712_cov_3.407316_1_plen_202_part_00